MGLGTGVRGGKNPPLPISSLGLPPPSLPPFPANFFFSSPWKVCYRAKLYQFFAFDGKKRGQRVGKKGKMRPCAIFCEERGAGLQRQEEISRAGKGEFQTQLLSPPTPSPNLFTVLYYPTSPDFVLWHAQFNNTIHNTLLTHGKIWG